MLAPARPSPFGAVRTPGNLTSGPPTGSSAHSLSPAPHVAVDRSALVHIKINSANDGTTNANNLEPPRALDRRAWREILLYS